ncbi:unnamed protein product [Closterium sp. NIES-53]
MIHAAAPHFLWPLAVQYAAHQINLQPRVSLPETSPTLRWTGKVGDASAFRVWGSRAFVRDLSADMLSSRAVPCVFLGFPPDAPGWQFYHPTSRRVLSSQDVTFDESVPYYRLFPYRTAPLPPPPPLFLTPVPPPVDPLPPQGPAPSGVSQVDAVEPVEVAGMPGGAEPESVVPGGAGSGGTVPECAEPAGAGSGGAESGGAEPECAEPGGAEPGVAESGGAVPAGTGPGGSSGALSRRELPSPQELREWFARRWRRAAGTGGAAGAGGSASTGGAGATGPGGARIGGTGAAGPGGATGAVATGGVGASGAAGVGATGGAGAGSAASAGGPAGAGAAGGTGAGGAAGAGALVGAGVGAPGAAGGTPGAGGAAGVGAEAGGAGVVPAGSGGAARPRPYFVPLLEQALGLPPSSGPAPSLECPPPVHTVSQLQLASPLPAPSPYAGPTGGLAERREPASRPASPVRTARTSPRAPRQRPPAVPGTHQMALRPSTAPQRIPLPSPPESSLPSLADPKSDSLRAASPTVTRFLATAVTDPSFESAAASALVAKLVHFAAHCRLVCEEFQCFAAALPHLVSTLLAPEGDPDAPDIPTPRSYAEAIEGPNSSQWQAAMDAEMASWKSTGTYVDKVPPPGANIIRGMWIFKVKRPPGSPPVFKARYVARGFSQRQGVDYFHTFSPTPKMTTLRVLLHVAAQRDYELHSLDFSTAFLQGSLHEEFWLRRPPGFTWSFPPGTQWSLRRPVYGLRQAPREWHNTLRTTLAALGFAPSTADPSLFLRTDTSLPPFYILVYVLQRFDFTYSSPQATPLSTRHSLSSLPLDESVEASGPYPELVGCLMYLMTCTRPDLAYPLSILARYVAPGRHRPEHMATAKRVLRYLCSTSGIGLVLGGRSPVVLTGHADASWVDDLVTQRSSQGYTFSLGSGSVSWQSTRSSSVLSSSCEAEIYAGAMAAQELRWLTYLLTDLGEPPRSPPVLYVDNKAMLALCREHRLEHRTKHIALRYFLARELQQRGQLRLAYVASQANTADIFTKALQPCDHQQDQDPTGGFRGDRAFASVADKADWDEQNVDNASEEARPLPYSSVNVPMDDENPRESANADVFYNFTDNGYVTPAKVNTNEAERIGLNFIPDPETGDEATYPTDTTLPRYTQSGLQILGLVTAVHGTEIPKEPATVQQALGGEHREKWREAMDKELKALEERNTWKVVPNGVAQNKTVLTGKWVFRVKTKADGTIDKFKARWVVRGFDQEHGRDFTETFAPVSRHTSLRILLAIAAMKKKKLRQINVANAFLYALVDTEIYVELPHGSHGEPNQVCQLQKSMYGIKQAPRLWQQYLHARLTSIGFRQLPHDQGMYRLTKGNDYILLIVYVDNLLYIGSTDNVTT